MSAAGKGFSFPAHSALQPSVVEPQAMAKGIHEALLLMTEGSRWQMCVRGSLARAAAVFSHRVTQSSAQRSRIRRKGVPSVHTKGRCGTVRAAAAEAAGTRLGAQLFCVKRLIAGAGRLAQARVSLLYR